MTTRFAGASIVMLAFSLGCGNTADGVRQDAENAAESTERAADATGAAISGAMITTEVKSAIVADSRIRSGEINVDTDDTRKTVTLKGFVMTEEEKVMAQQVAVEKAEGYAVVNELIIRPE